MIQLTNVTRTYPGRVSVTALDAVTLRFEPGELAAIMGPSGSGKSTLLNLMGGLDVPSVGSLVVAGRDLAKMSEEERSLFRRAHVAYIFQSYHLMPTLSAAQNVALPLHLQNLPRREIGERVAEALAVVGLSARGDHLPDELSGGERQRVGIGRALVTRAPLLLADEPTGNLDSARGQEIMELLVSIHRERGSTMVMVTHDPRAASHCSRIIQLADGRIAEDTRR